MPRGGYRPNAGRKKRNGGDTSSAPKHVERAQRRQPAPPPPQTELKPDESTTLDLQARFGLTRREFLFVQLILTEPGVSQGDAYVQAGYQSKSSEAARANSARLITKDRVVRALAAGRQAIAERNVLTQDLIVRQLAYQVLADPRKLFDKETRSVKFPSEWDDATAMAISGVEVVTRSAGKDEIEYVHKFRFVDRVGSESLLMRHMGMLREQQGETQRAVKTFTREDLAGMSDADIAEALAAAQKAAALLRPTA